MFLKLNFGLVNSNNSCIAYLFLNIGFILTNSADPDEMPHCVAAAHLGLYSLLNCLFISFQL